MPIPTPRKDEDRNNFMSRCMGDEKMKEDYPNNDQRIAVCMSKAIEGMNHIAAADYQMYFESYGCEEELTEDNFYVPQPEEYVTMSQIKIEIYVGEEEEEDEEEVEDKEEMDEEDQAEWDIAVERPGLWENIRKKKEREGKKYKPAKPGDPDRPDPEAWKKAQSKNKFKYKNPKTGEYSYYERQGVYKKDGVTLLYEGKAEESSEGAEYQGRKVTLNKPFRTPNGPKKFAVYTKNESGNVVIVRFGDPNMKIKKNIPERRKSFRARHNCDNPGPKWKARYWSCQWSW